MMNDNLPFSLNELVSKVKDKSDSEPVTNSHVKVVVRVRPPSQRESVSKYKNIIRILDSNVLVFDPKTEYIPGLCSDNSSQKHPLERSEKDKRFAFDHIFGPDSNNEHVFEQTTKQMLDNLLAGYNCSVFAYGATGAGKTHTMNGTDHNPGVTFYTVTELFQRVIAIAKEKTCEVAVSYLEVYNERVYDLLTDNKRELDLRQGSGESVTVAGLSSHSPTSADEILDMLHNGNCNRTQHPTDANAESSRSHAVFQVFIRQRSSTSGVSAKLHLGKLTLVDLAGSERAITSCNTGDRQREGANINRSLLALGSCLNALADNKKTGYVPFRNSKLTRILKDSLGGNCYTIMICAISPSSLCYEDTLNSLKYANRAKQIKAKIKNNVVEVDFHVSSYASIVDTLSGKLESVMGELAKYKSGEQVLRPQTATLEKPTIDEIRRFQTCLFNVFEDRKSIRKEYLELDGKCRDMVFNIHWLLRTLDQMLLMGLRPGNKHVDRVRHQMSNCENRHSTITQRMGNVHKRMQTNCDDLEELREEMDDSSGDSPLPEILESALKAFHLEVELREVTRHNYFLKKLCRTQERRAQNSQKVIVSLMELQRKQMLLLSATGMDLSALEPDVKNIYGLICQTEKELVWADQNTSDINLSKVTEQPPWVDLNINKLLDLPVMRGINTDDHGLLYKSPRPIDSATRRSISRSAADLDLGLNPGSFSDSLFLEKVAEFAAEDDDSNEGKPGQLNMDFKGELAAMFNIQPRRPGTLVHSRRASSKADGEDSLKKKKIEFRDGISMASFFENIMPDKWGNESRPTLKPADLVTEDQINDGRLTPSVEYKSKDDVNVKLEHECDNNIEVKVEVSHKSNALAEKFSVEGDHTGMEEGKLTKSEQTEIRKTDIILEQTVKFPCNTTMEKSELKPNHSPERSQITHLGESLNTENQVQVTHEEAYLSEEVEDSVCDAGSCHSTCTSLSYMSSSDDELEACVSKNSTEHNHHLGDGDATANNCHINVQDLLLQCEVIAKASSGHTQLLNPAEKCLPSLGMATKMASKPKKPVSADRRSTVIHLPTLDLSADPNINDRSKEADQKFRVSVPVASAKAKKLFKSKLSELTAKSKMPPFRGFDHQSAHASATYPSLLTKSVSFMSIKGVCGKKPILKQPGKAAVDFTPVRTTEWHSTPQAAQQKQLDRKQQLDCLSYDGESNAADDIASPQTSDHLHKIADLAVEAKHGSYQAHTQLTKRNKGEHLMNGEDFVIKKLELADRPTEAKRSKTKSAQVADKDDTNGKACPFKAASARSNACKDLLLDVKSLKVPPCDETVPGSEKDGDCNVLDEKTNHIEDLQEKQPLLFSDTSKTYVIKAACSPTDFEDLSSGSELAPSSSCSLDEHLSSCLSSRPPSPCGPGQAPLVPHPPTMEKPRLAETNITDAKTTLASYVTRNIKVTSSHELVHDAMNTCGNDTVEEKNRKDELVIKGTSFVLMGKNGRPGGIVHDAKLRDYTAYDAEHSKKFTDTFRSNDCDTTKDKVPSKVYQVSHVPTHSMQLDKSSHIKTKEGHLSKGLGGTCGVMIKERAYDECGPAAGVLGKDSASKTSIEKFSKPHKVGSGDLPLNPAKHSSKFPRLTQDYVSKSKMDSMNKEDESAQNLQKWGLPSVKTSARPAGRSVWSKPSYMCETKASRSKHK